MDDANNPAINHVYGGLSPAIQKQHVGRSSEANPAIRNA